MHATLRILRKQGFLPATPNPQYTRPQDGYPTGCNRVHGCIPRIVPSARSGQAPTEQLYRETAFSATGSPKPYRANPMCFDSMRRVSGSSAHLKVTVSAERSVL